MNLSSYLNSWLADAARWGETDCCLAVLDWVGAHCDRDLSGPLRFTYDSFGTAQKESRFFTDPLAACARYMVEPAQLQLTDAPKRGDVVLYKALSHGGRILPTMGIAVTDGMVASRSAPGDPPNVLCARPGPLQIAAWSLPCG